MDPPKVKAIPWNYRLPRPMRPPSLSRFLGDRSAFLRGQPLGPCLPAFEAPKPPQGHGSRVLALDRKDRFAPYSLGDNSRSKLVQVVFRGLS